ncbi:DarT ssDNA thymidine ADP-ribosyltransferase family protein [Cryobacterium mannosilyticum]|uniref:DarT ssDNA thymidine ADP-ribosyltransferase family protein n=1 Tax=Cryobacterium mannosilyticum TaxID=1259190 RepID=UPI00141B919E|nr:DarT ssDNA thymidine ADP-ribosyltransferase family protein [Cryobacterium mannosilyticum]
MATRVVGAAKAVADNVGEQRIYHVTHIRNLAGILESGALLADMSEAWTTRPVVDISSAPNRDARRTALVSGDGSSSVAGYVPFFLSPNARLWDGLLTGTADPRLSVDAHTAEIFDFVILVSTVKKLRDAQAAAEDAGADDASDAAVAVTDGDAAGALTRISATPETSDSLLRRLRADAESDGILRAELLVAETFPFDLVTLVGVANDKVRDEVRGILAASTHKPKVAVYPPWFHAAEATAAL